MNHPSFSVVIPTYQRREVVCAAVQSLCRVTYEGPVEIIVVVDGSTDGTAEALALLQCPAPLRIIEQDNRGASAARNHGAAEAKSDILLFLDDDMISEPDLLEQHARMYGDGADAVTGDVFLDPGSPRTFLTESVERWIGLPRPAAADLPFHIYTGQLSMRRRVFNEIGRFDEGFTSEQTFGHEDTDVGVKLLARYRVRHNPRAVTRQRYVVGAREMGLWLAVPAAESNRARREGRRGV